MTRSSVFVRSDAHSTPLFAVREPIVTPEMSRRCPRELGRDRACSALGPFIAAIFRRTAALSAVHATISPISFGTLRGLGWNAISRRRDAKRGGQQRLPSRRSDKPGAKIGRQTDYSAPLHIIFSALYDHSASTR
jgi:hypothetical protein